MRFISTRNPADAVSGSTAVLSGLAPDGGLYVPESFPPVSMKEIEDMTALDYPERSARIMSLFFDELSYDVTADRPRWMLCVSLYPRQR